MLRSLTILLLSAVLTFISAVALPATVLAQGAGDDQYADPFGDMPVQEPADTGGGGGGNVTPPADTGEVAPDTSGTPVAADDSSDEADAAAAAPAAAPGETLPRTGLPAGLLALAGVALLACGTLIHFSLLRLAPNSGYARALRMGPLHQAPRPPGFEPLGASRRIRRSRRR